jgi:thiamine biosynthesis lipoprotein
VKRERSVAASARAHAALLGTLALVGAAGTARADDEPAKPAAPGVFVRSTQTMGTRLTLTLYTADERGAAEVTRDVFAEFARIAALMTTWTEDSAVSRLNAAAGRKAVVIDDEVFTVLEAALAMTKLSSGAFDVTVGAYQGLWKFDQDKDGTVPSDAEIAARLPLIGAKRLVLDAKKKTARLTKKGMRITLGGVAKGYAVDRAVALLRGRGFAHFIVQAGGDLYVAGRRGERRWRVGIRDPRGSADAPFALAEVEDATFSTSGDYERGFVKDGVRYHHILDPKTGRPVTGCRSVTVMAKDAMTADGLSTSLFVMGVAAGMALVESLPDVEAVFVDTDNRVHVSSGLAGKLQILAPPTPGI